MSWLEIVLIGVCAVVALIPPSLCPAIRAKERRERERMEKEPRHD